jgi:hypothetical protein
VIDPSLMPRHPEAQTMGRVWTEMEKRSIAAYGLQCYQLAMERAADLAYDAAIRYSQGYAVDFKAEFALQENTK